MPDISRTFIKAGMVFFMLSMIAGLLLEMNFEAFPALMPLFWHMLMVGWITQIIMGVSIWMFPGRTRETDFMSQKWSWMAFGFLNAGLILRIVAEPMLSYSNLKFWSVLTVLSAVFQLLAGASYFIEMWPRILSKKQQLKRRKKKRSS